MTPNTSAPRWRKSSYSTGGGANCVEVADSLPGVIAVRDSKDPDGPELAFTPAAWAAFLGGAKTGQFNAL
jgi:hypothetical protein